MAVCNEWSKNSVAKCLLEEDHDGGHRGVDYTNRFVLAWSHQDSDPILVGLR